MLGIGTHTDVLLSDGRAAGLEVPISYATDGHSYTCFRTERSAGHGRTSVGGLSSLKAPECVMTTTGLRGDADDGRSPWHLCRRDSISFIQLSFSKIGNGPAPLVTTPISKVSLMPSPAFPPTFLPLPVLQLQQGSQKPPKNV